MSRWMWIGLFALSFGCGDSSDPASTESAQTTGEGATASGAEEPVEAVEETVAEAPEGARDLAGLSAQLNDDGTITISGTDRWGGELSYTYADTEYLKNAVPVLARSITQEQATALGEYADELAEGGGASSGEPAEPAAPEEPTGGGGGE